MLFSVLALVGLSGCLSLSGSHSKGHPALRIFRAYDAADECAYHISPYTVNLMAIDMLRKGDSSSEVKEYIEWYLSHLNYPDKFELTGTVYDYVVCRDGCEVPIDFYDSVDGYAGTFLILLRNYLFQTNDRELVRVNKKKIFDIAYLLIHLKDEDGLVRILEDSDVKYLMGNAEAFGGLKAFNEIAELMDWGENSYYIEAQDNLKDAILTRMYDEKSQTFYWAIERELKYESSWERIYPDAYTQLFPIIYGVVDEDSDVGKRLWEEFSKRYDESDLPDIEQKIVFRLAVEVVSR